MESRQGKFHEAVRCRCFSFKASPQQQGKASSCPSGLLAPWVTSRASYWCFLHALSFLQRGRKPGWLTRRPPPPHNSSYNRTTRISENIVREAMQW